MSCAIVVVLCAGGEVFPYPGGSAKENVRLLILERDWDVKHLQHLEY
jgi:hypothetical protein